MEFISPDSIVKPTPSIKNLMQDPPPTPIVPPTSAPTAPQTKTVTPDVKIDKIENLTTTTPSSNTQPQNLTPLSQPAETKSTTPQNSNNYPENFMKCWSQLIDSIFADVPTLHTPLKNYTPTLKDNIVNVPLKNERQIEDFTIKKTAILQYLRANFDEKIDDVVTTLVTNQEVKKFILDEHDKLQALREQNPDVVDFITALNLRLRN